LLNEESVVFLDEFGVSCSSRVRYVRSEISSPARKIVRSIRSKNYLMSAVIVKSRQLQKQRLTATYIYRDFIIELIEKMNELLMTNYMLIMDNCTIHKVLGIRDVIEKNGHNLMFLPPYSSQLNAIEEYFSKWKGNVNSANSNTIAELKQAIWNGGSSITEKDCEGFFKDVRKYAVKAIRRENF